MADINITVNLTVDEDEEADFRVSEQILKAVSPIAYVKPDDENPDDAILYVEDVRGSTSTKIKGGTVAQEYLDSLAEKIDGAFIETTDGLTYLYLTSEDEVKVGPLGPFSGTGGGGGGGGGSSDGNSVLTLTNTTGWLSKSIGSGSMCEITFTWSSLEDELSTGDGQLVITVNGAKKKTQSVHQGDLAIEVSQYLISGTNKVKITVTDVYGKSRSINYTITVIALSLTSTFDNSQPFDGAIRFPYTPVGLTDKVVHFELDGTELDTVETSSSGVQLTLELSAMSHGTHRLKCWFTSAIDGETVSSNTLYYEFACIVSGNTRPIIWTDWAGNTVTQYETILIKYYVYSTTLSTPIRITLTDGTEQSLTVDRTEQTLSTKALEPGTKTISIATATTPAAAYTISMTVAASDIDISAVTDDLQLYLNAYGRSNNEANPATWTYGDVSATFTDFNWTSDGWKQDADGNTVLRVADDGRLSIPFTPFDTDFKRHGKTISIDFKTSAVRNYDTPIITCMSGGVGFAITPQSIRMASMLTAISMQFKEDEHVRVDLVVEKSSENCLIYMYINGIMSRVRLYPANDDFAQATPVGITIGSNDATTDIYCIRVYDNDLTRQQVLKNWIADTQDITTLLERYERNNVFNAYSQVVIDQLPPDLPYMILEGPELPQDKTQTKYVDGSFTDPSGTFPSFTFTGAQIKVQGTSSQFYARKNYKIKFKEGFVINGTTKPTYAMRTTAIPTNTFTMKADVASSEGANNVELVRVYCDMCPYQTPAQQEEPKIRQGIDGFPMVIFWNNGQSTTFLGKYNFNNDKGTPEVFGFEEPDESWEIKNNTSNRVIWKNADYSGGAWLDDFEGRFPDGYADPSQLAEFAAWVVSTDPEQATNANLASSVTYDGTTYTKDSAAYRLAKFRAEITDYCELDSALFYYLFTEAFLMVDSRAKNAFPSFIGSEVSA